MRDEQEELVLTRDEVVEMVKNFALSDHTGDAYDSFTKLIEWLGLDDSECEDNNDLYPLLEEKGYV